MEPNEITIENDNQIEIEEKPIVKKIETKEEKWKRLFTKRTIGKIFDCELGDYYRRKNDLLSMKLYIERE